MTGESSRRGQSASGAAILIAIIGGFLVLYILFLPPAQREQLLFGDDAGQGGYQGGYGSGYQGTYGSGGEVFTEYGPLVMLAAVPGTLRLQRYPTEEHNVPSATVFTSVQTTELRHIDSAIVKNAAFASQAVEIEFEARAQASNNYLLSFNVARAGDAPLRVLLNGKLLQERPMLPGTPPPIPLPTDYLVDGKNTLTIETSTVGLAFWRANTYQLANILVSADLIDVSGSVSEQTFSIEEPELLGMERAELVFVPECDPRSAGRLVVQLNSRLVQGPDNTTQEYPNTLYNGFVDCGVQFKTDVPRSHLRIGENRVLFAAQGGQYIVDRIKLITYLKENDYPVYYFNMNPELYDSLDAGNGAVRLTLRFSDYRDEKRGEIIVNGFVQSFTTRDYVYQALVDPAILLPGPNTLQIAPHVDKLDIAELRVELI